MKSTFAMWCALMLVGCGGGGNPAAPDGGATVGTEAFVATINGQPFRANLLSTSINTIYPRRLLLITARESCTSGFAIHLQLERLPAGEVLTTGAYSTTVQQRVLQQQASGLEPGVYREFHATLANDRENVYWNAPDSNGAGSGRATITALTDTSVEGNFSFDALSDITGGRAIVGSGSFRLKLENRRICTSGKTTRDSSLVGRYSGLGIFADFWNDSAARWRAPAGLVDRFGEPERGER